MIAASATIVLGVLLVVPTAYWIRLRLPQLRPIVEFITLLPLVIPAIVIVFGYIRHLQLDLVAAAHRRATRGTDVLLIFGYVDAGAALHVPRRRHRACAPSTCAR